MNRHRFAKNCESKFKLYAKKSRHGNGKQMNGRRKPTHGVKKYWKQIEYNIQQKSKYEADLGSLRNEIELLKSKLLPDSETI
jgi:hypothetical protein